MTEEFNRNWSKLAPFALSYEEKSAKNSTHNIGNSIRDFYFGNEPIDLSTRENLTNMFSDRNFYQCNREGALLHAKFSPVYLYYFTQEGDMSWLDYFQIPKDLGKYK